MKVCDLRFDTVYEGAKGRRRKIVDALYGRPTWGETAEPVITKALDFRWEPVSGWAPKSRGGWILPENFADWAVREVVP